ncbi:SPOSA6832_03302, partial [Sporobolomyces salmonicolor]
MRLSPRPCINQKLVDELKVLRDYRFAEFGCMLHRSRASSIAAGSPEGIAYATAISAIISTPYKITSGHEARKIHKIGQKLAKKVDEFVETGKIQDAQDMLENERFIALRSLMTVHGVGHLKAKDLYAAGYRSAEDLKKTGEWEKEFRYYDDIQLKIPRSEVESICEWVRVQLDRIEPGAHIAIVGGYRRGKRDSNDVDLLITYPHQDGKERGILRRLCHRLKAKEPRLRPSSRAGLVPPEGILSFSQPATKRTTRENKQASSFDALDKALVIFKHPANRTTRPRDVYRRVDLIVARWPAFGAALLGWSGSTQFERDLRKHAEHMGYKFDSGGLRTRATGEVVPTATEKDVFRALKLEYIPPEFRNADP